MEYKFPCKKLDDILVPTFYSHESIDRLRNLETRSSDIIINSYPRTGTHWLAYTVALIVNNGTFPPEAFRNVACFLGQSLLNTQDQYLKQPTTRILYDHVPYKYMRLNGLAKRIYIARNPKEVAVSFYNFLAQLKNNNHFLSWFFSFSGTWEEFFDLFIRGDFYYGSYLDHVAEWWEHRNDENVLFIWYENFLEHREETIEEIANFLGYKLSDETIASIATQTSFKEMKREAKISSSFYMHQATFFRSGTNNSWKNMFTAEMDQQMKEALTKYAEKFDLHFNTVYAIEEEENNVVANQTCILL